MRSGGDWKRSYGSLYSGTKGETPDTDKSDPAGHRASPRPYQGSYVVDSETGDGRQDEWFLLADMDGQLQYIAKTNGNPAPTVFSLVSISAESMTFENLDHDFPQHIIYKREGDAFMTVTIEGPVAHGETRRIDFLFKRFE